jgi:hypothetical protein
MPGLSIRRLAGAVAGKLGIEREADHTSGRKPGLDYMAPVAEPMANIRPGRDPRNAGISRDRGSDPQFDRGRAATIRRFRNGLIALGRRDASHSPVLIGYSTATRP